MRNTFRLLAAGAALLAVACLPENTQTEKQDYAGNHVSVTAPESVIPAEGGTYQIQVVTDVPIEISIPKVATWLTASVQQDAGTVSMPEGDGDDVTWRDRPYSIVTFTATSNPGLDRYASVGVIDSDTKFSLYRLDVHQAGSIVEIVKKDFQVSPESISVDADATSAQIDVVAEVAWTAVSSNPAVVLSPASGSGNATVTVSFPANTNTENTVTAEFTFSTEDPAAKISQHKVTFTQAKAKPTGLPAVKPAPGTVLAEWSFEETQAEALRAGGFEKVSAEDDNAVGNGGGPYVPSNVSGNGKLEYYNGTDKSAKSTKKNKRRIGERGEPCIYCVWVGDYILWTAEPDAPLAAGTKFKLNFALRPNAASIMRDWQCEFLDGDEWKPVGDPIQLEFHASAAGTAEDPKQVNCIIERTATLTKDTPSAQFRITCTQNAQCGDGSPLEALTGDALRFAGKWLNATPDQQYLQVPENPKIVVVE